MSHSKQTLNKQRDGARIWTQFQAVQSAMKDGQWWTLNALQTVLLSNYSVRASTPAISARIRDLRKLKFGAHRVDNRYVASGLWEYRLVEQDSSLQ